MNIPALRADLLAWFDQFARELPWRMVHAGGPHGESGRDPYRVWVSEVLLQQTQVSRGKLYFERFITQFPTVHALANAPQEAVLKAWEGCGYYARARNLHQAAQQVARSSLPTTYAEWLALPGVGPYTAAAVSSLAFGERRAVNDGNVRRVLARLYAQPTPAPRWVQQQADALLDPARPGDWNEALMDLGATLCTPKAPQCGRCPLTAHCQAYQQAQPSAYPAPKPRTAVKAVTGAALILTPRQDPDTAQADQHVYLEQRTGTLLGGLYGLPVQEGEDVAQALSLLCQRLHVAQHAPAPRHLGTVQHAMTHRRITLQIFHAELPPTLSAQEVAQHPLSRLDHKALALLGAPERLLYTDFNLNLVNSAVKEGPRE